MTRLQRQRCFKWIRVELRSVARIGAVDRGLPAKREFEASPLKE